MKKIGIIGCGWLGMRLAEKLSSRYAIYTTMTTEAKVEMLESKGFHPTIKNFPDYLLTEKNTPWEIVKELDAVIITIPFSEKRSCASSLYNRFQNLVSFIGDFKGQLFFMSSTSVYPIASEDFTEAMVPSENVSVERMVKTKYPQVNMLRLAGLMGDNRLLKNYKVSDIHLPVNHIHYADAVAVIEKMIELESQQKLYNVVAPLHPSKKEVIQAQEQNIYDTIKNAEGRTISASKLITELNYDFIYPNPATFHLPISAQNTTDFNL